MRGVSPRLRAAHGPDYFILGRRFLIGESAGRFVGRAIRPLILLVPSVQTFPHDSGPRQSGQSSMCSESASLGYDRPHPHARQTTRT